ncbi:hypothetical protein D3C87_1720370 [compost metagenome]
MCQPVQGALDAGALHEHHEIETRFLDVFCDVLALLAIGQHVEAEDLEASGGVCGGGPRSALTMNNPAALRHAGDNEQQHADRPPSGAHGEQQRRQGQCRHSKVKAQ